MIQNNETLIQQSLQDLLVDLVALSLDGKQLHWHVTGPLFKPVHEQLDEVVDLVRTASDDVAERAVALGLTVDARPSTVAKEHQLPEQPEGWLDAAEAVRRYVESIDGTVERARTAIEALEVEPVTQDLVIGIVASLEKQRWLLAAQVR
jgi:starvation-inducible DNA-binding protein